MSANKSKPTVTVTARPRTSSSDSVALSLRTPRAARFAEATAIISPIEAPTPGQTPFSHSLTSHFLPQPQSADFGSGRHVSVEMEEVDLNHMPKGAMTPASPLMDAPLKSALKTPGTSKPIFTPTFREEEDLEKMEEHTEKEQAKDLKVKTRVRMAKFLLRGVNFSCSLIVLSMLSATFSIFNATKSMPPRYINSTKFPPWAAKQQTWPQITILVISCVSLAMCLMIFYAYSRGGHRRAEKAAIYYTTFAIASFVFSTVMWLIGAAVLHSSKANGNSQDMWGWSCNKNTRASLFQTEVDYDLVCRLQNWSLVCCVIEIVVEVITISIYGIVFYRYYTKRRLRKSMANRDKARSDLYLAQLRTQSAPNTPGLNNPFSPTRQNHDGNPYSLNAIDADAKDASRYVDVDTDPARLAHPKPFVLQPPPIKINGPTPRMEQTGFTPLPTQTPSPARNIYGRTPSPPQQMQRNVSPVEVQRSNSDMWRQSHVDAAPGERVYDAVPIPGAYVHPSSPVHGGFPRP